MSNNKFLDQMTFDSSDFVENPEPRCPCLLLLDTSASMSGEPIRELNAGLAQFKEEVMEDTLAMKRVEVAVITFGPVKIVNNFHTVKDLNPPVLSADGLTPMGEAIRQGLDLLRARKDEIRSSLGSGGLFKPWIILITDGAPTDEWQSAAKLIHEGEENNAFSFFAIGVKGADMNTLRKICTPNRVPLPLKGYKFREFFYWLSNSMKDVSASSPGEKVPLRNPVGWAEV